MMSVSAADESSEQSLPSFTTFSSELDPSWDYYDRNQSTDVITSQSNNYTRPWEMDPKDGRGFEPYPKLPSFQSQFQPFTDPTLVVPEPSLAQPVPVPVSPSSASPIGGGGQLTQLTQLTTTPLTSLHHQPTCLTTLPSTTFHTLTAVNSVAQRYPLVPAPIQARDIPTIQQQYLDERHIQIYQPITAFPQQGVVTVLKNEPANFDLKNGIHTFHQSPIPMDNGYDVKPVISIKNESPAPTPRSERPKKDRRKRAQAVVTSTIESDHAMDTSDSNNPGQVAAVSSTANFKSPMMSMDESTNENGEKQVSWGFSLDSCSQIIGIVFSFIICCRQRKNVNDAASVLDVKRRTIVAIVPHVVMTKVIKSANNVDVKS